MDHEAATRRINTLLLQQHPLYGRNALFNARPTLGAEIASLVGLAFGDSDPDYVSIDLSVDDAQEMSVRAFAETWMLHVELNEGEVVGNLIARSTLVGLRVLHWPNPLSFMGDQIVRVELTYASGSKFIVPSNEASRPNKESVAAFWESLRDDLVLPADAG